VPAAAIVEREGRKVVYVVKDGKAAEVPIETGASFGDLVQASGLKAGEKVVLKPSDRVRDGVEVSTGSK
jgi:multidrug efflux pump subunit AcrA (membrane-fusion protein)